MTAARKKKEADPETQLADLERAFSAGKPSRLVLFRGEERYFRERGIDLVKARCVALGWEITTHGTKDPDFDRALLLGDLSGGSLFAAARCVVVRDAGVLLGKEEKEQSAFVRAALAFAASPDVDGTLVVSADAIRADHALARAAASDGVLVGCRRLFDSAPPWNSDPRQAELVQWLARRARARKIALTPDQALYVAVSKGNDLYALDAELDKLATSGGRALKDVVGWSASVSPFEVAQHIVAGELARAVGGVHALFRGGFQDRDGTRLVDSSGLAAILLNALVRGVRQSLAGALAAEAGEDPFEGAARVGWSMPPRHRETFTAQVGLRSPAQWRAMHATLGKLELESRTGRELDAEDFTFLALAWRTTARARPSSRRA